MDATVPASATSTDQGGSASTPTPGAIVPEEPSPAEGDEVDDSTCSWSEVEVGTQAGLSLSEYERRLAAAAHISTDQSDSAEWVPNSKRKEWSKMDHEWRRVEPPVNMSQMPPQPASAPKALLDLIKAFEPERKEFFLPPSFAFEVATIPLRWNKAAIYVVVKHGSTGLSVTELQDDSVWPQPDGSVQVDMPHVMLNAPSFGISPSSSLPRHAFAYSKSSAPIEAHVNYTVLRLPCGSVLSDPARTSAGSQATLLGSREWWTAQPCMNEMTWIGRAEEGGLGGSADGGHPRTAFHHKTCVEPIPSPLRDLAIALRTEN